MPGWTQLFRHTAPTLAIFFCTTAALATDWTTEAPSEAGFAPDFSQRLDAALDSETGQGLHAVVVTRNGFTASRLRKVMCRRSTHR